MSVTSKMLLDLLSQSRWTGISTGKAKNQRSRLDRMRDEATLARRALLDELGSRGSDAKDKEPQHVHPEKTSRSIRREADDLTPAELVWLQRLPVDPTQITHDEASRLAAMYSSISGMNAESSKQLVASIWLPVKAVHDQLVAADDLKRARQPLPPTPPTAVDAVAEALRYEHPDWHPSALAPTASELISNVLSGREQEHQRRLAAAQAAVERLRDEAADREALTKRSS
jgi:hypothetical protein